MKGGMFYTQQKNFYLILFLIQLDTKVFMLHYPVLSVSEVHIPFGNSLKGMAMAKDPP